MNLYFPCSDPNLHFVASPALKPPEVEIDFSQQQRIEEEIRKVADQPLPDDEDDFFY